MAAVAYWGIVVITCASGGVLVSSLVEDGTALLFAVGDRLARWVKYRSHGRSAVHDRLAALSLPGEGLPRGRQLLHTRLLAIRRLVRRAGLPSSLQGVLLVIGGAGLGAVMLATWALAYFGDPWVTVLCVVLAFVVPFSALEVLAGFRRRRVEGQVAAAAYAIATDLLGDRNPLQALERAASKLPEPTRTILVDVKDRIRAGRDPRDERLVSEIGQFLIDELDTRRADLFVRCLVRAWDHPQMAARMLLSYSVAVGDGGWLRQQSAAKLASYRFWGWSVLGGSLLAFILIPTFIPGTRGYLATEEGLQAIRWWLASALVGLSASRFSSRLPGG